MTTQRCDPEEEEGKTGRVLRTTPGQVGWKHRMEHQEMKLVRPTEAGARSVLCPAERSLGFLQPPGGASGFSADTGLTIHTGKALSG